MPSILVAPPSMTLTRLLVALPFFAALPAAAAGAAAAAAATKAPPETPTAPLPLPEQHAEPDWEGAIAFTASYAPTFQGSPDARVRVTPGFYVRYGRVSISSAAGFVTRRADDVIRGLGVDLRRTDRLRVSLSARYDSGRDESRDPALAGLGDIKPTLRLRLGGGFRISDDWRIGASWSVDAFGRGGGNWGEMNIGRSYPITPDTSWSWNASLSAAGDRYMQTYFGITPEQSANTGGRYAVYEPNAGLRDVAVSIGLKSDLNERWVGLLGAGASRLLGPAAHSPLTTERNGWGVNAGLAWRF